MKQLRPGSEVEFVQFFPEAHHAWRAAGAHAPAAPSRWAARAYTGQDTAVGGNFGAFTTNRPASSRRRHWAATSVIIGHCEERSDKRGHPGARPA